MMRAQTKVTLAAASIGLLAIGSGCSLFSRPVAHEARLSTPANPMGPSEGVSGEDTTGVGPGADFGAKSGAQARQAASPRSRPVHPTSLETMSNAADLMFQSDEPFSQQPSNVNVFGELDGFGPSVFNPGGQGGYQQHTSVDEGYDADPEISPDGEHLLFTSTRHTEHPDIYLQRVDGLAVTQLTTDPADDGFARFSPDGQRIAFASNRSGNWDIYVMDADGKNVEQVTRSAANEIHPTFSPDGQRLAFCAMGLRSGQWELWTVDLRTSRLQMIGYGLFPDWSPRTDKDVIAFQRSRQRGTRWFSAWTVELTGDDAKNLTEIAYSTNAAIVCPKWNLDGTKLTFCSIIDPNASETVNEQVHGTTQDIWIVNADGTSRQRLTDGKGINATPTWARDGRVYFVSDRGGKDAIWSIATSASTGLAKSKAAKVDTAAAETGESR